METRKQRNTLKSARTISSNDVVHSFAIPSSRIQQIQADMTHRALELLNLPPDEPAFLLDIGCGSGLSGEILEEEGYMWTGVDIAPSMLGD
jgi:18S rRNA (guanine1575-N7)-methyltransferase